MLLKTILGIYMGIGGSHEEQNLFGNLLPHVCNWSETRLLIEQFMSFIQVSFKFSFNDRLCLSAKEVTHLYFSYQEH